MSDSLQEQLDALRAADAVTLQARFDLVAQRKVEGEIKARTELAAKYGQLGVDFAIHFTVDGEMVACRRPDAAPYKLFVDTTNSGKGSLYDASFSLVRSCLIYPDKAEYARICTDRTNTPVDLANVAAELAGARKQEVEGK